MTSLSLQHRFAEGEPDAPVLLLLHGTGGGPDDLLDVAQHLDSRAGVLAPAGPVSEQGAARWFRRLAEGVFDIEDVIARTHQLGDFVRDARKHYAFADRRIVGVGFSNGANIAAALLLLRPDVLQEAALFAAMMPVPQPPSLDLAGTRVFLSNGEQDPMAPLDSADTLVQALQEGAADVEVHRHGGGHQVTLDAVRAAAAWLVR